MDQVEIQALFREFAAPLDVYAQLGARSEAMETLAKNLWATMIGGPEAESQMWDQLRQAGGVDAELLESIRRCYYQEMKSALSDEQLADLRQRYGMRVEEEP